MGLDHLKRKPGEKKEQPKPATPKPAKAEAIKFAWKCKCPITVNDIQSALCPNCRKPKVVRVMKPRLNHSVEKTVRYEHLNGLWVGTMTVDGFEGVGFDFTAASEAKCFHGLDDLYREWLKGSQH